MLNSINVMLVDDHILIRQGIRQLLESDGSMKIIDEAADGNECLEKLKYIQPDIILLYIEMPGKNGIEVLKEIKESKKDVKTLILTAHNELKYVIAVINNGADGYLIKDSDISELRKAIHLILNGEKYIRPDLVQILNYKLESEDLNEKDENRFVFLTRREQEVLLKVATGMSNKEIATNLNVSERTVKNHMSNIFKKIKVSDRTQAAIYALKSQVV